MWINRWWEHRRLERKRKQVSLKYGMAAEDFASAELNNHYWRMVAGLEEPDKTYCGHLAAEVRTVLESCPVPGVAHPSDELLLDWGEKFRQLLRERIDKLHYQDATHPSYDQYRLFFKGGFSLDGFFPAESSYVYEDIPEPNELIRQMRYIWELHRQGIGPLLMEKPKPPEEYFNLVDPDYWYYQLQYWWEHYGTKENPELCEIRQKIDVIRKHYGDLPEFQEDLKNLEELYRAAASNPEPATLLVTRTLADDLELAQRRAEAITEVEAASKALSQYCRKQAFLREGVQKVNLDVCHGTPQPACSDSALVEPIETEVVQ